jgi:hypothetical protein
MLLNNDTELKYIAVKYCGVSPQDTQTVNGNWVKTKIWRNSGGGGGRRTCVTKIFVIFNLRLILLW